MVTYTSLIFLIRYLIALLAIALYTLLERKLLGYFQLRKGPNKVALMGLPQPLADALKLFLKEQSKPTIANTLPFLIAPIIALSLALFLWLLYPISSPTHFAPFGVLLFLCISRFNVYTTLAAGWSSNSKYALLGAIRRIAQTISYEVTMSLILLTLLITIKTFDFSHIIQTTHTPKSILLLPIALIWFISLLAETSRTPFDLAEGESELVSGFNVEYRAGSFALIFIAEYINILVISLFTSVLLIPHFYQTPISNLLISSFTLAIAALFIWIRATFPRLRYDRLIALTWKSFLPTTLALFIITFSLSANL